MGIPKYIIDSARKYRDEHGGSELLLMLLLQDMRLQESQNLIKLS